MTKYLFRLILCFIFFTNILNASLNSWWKNRTTTEKFFYVQIPAYAGTLIYGYYQWEYGFKDGFEFKKNPKFFDVKTQGMDKFGHAWVAYTYSSFMADYLDKRGFSKSKSSNLGFLSSVTFMTFIEVMDGFSKYHRFDYKDEIADIIGASTGAIRYYYPNIGKKLDYRFEYAPTWTEGLGTDYNGQKYFIALKPSGFKSVQNTALKYVDLVLGYYGRKKLEELKATLFSGVSYNAAALVSNKYTPSNIFNYYQLPHTSLVKEFYTKITYSD